MEGRGSPETGTEAVSIHEASGDFANPEFTTTGLKPFVFCSSVLEGKKYSFLVVLWLLMLSSLWKHT